MKNSLKGAAQSANAEKKVKVNANANVGAKSTTEKAVFDAAKASIRLASLQKDAKKSKEAFQKASENLQRDQYAAYKYAVEIAHQKHNAKAELTSEEQVLHDMDKYRTNANLGGLGKAYTFVDEFVSSLRDETKAARDHAKSLNSAVRNLLADWVVFEPIFNALGIKKADVKPSLLQSASPFLMLPTAEGCKVGMIKRIVKRDAKGNPIKVEGAKQYIYGLKAVTAWDAVTFMQIVVTIELSNKNKVFDALAEEQHKILLDNAVKSLKALQDEKEAAKAARLAAKQARKEAETTEDPAKKAELEKFAKAKDEKAKESAKAASKAKKQTKAPISKIGKAKENASEALAAAKALVA